MEKKMETFNVVEIEEAKHKLDELTRRDLADKTITDNVGGLEIQQIEGVDDWEEWECPQCCEDIFHCKCNK